MQVFEDGLAEIAIKGTDSESGPSMLRIPEGGVSLISVKSSTGKPGATMMASEQGRSMVTVTDTSGKHRGRAELLVAPEGEVGVRVTDAKGQVTDLAAPPKSE